MESWAPFWRLPRLRCAWRKPGASTGGKGGGMLDDVNLDRFEFVEIMKINLPCAPNEGVWMNEQKCWHPAILGLELEIRCLG